MSTHDDIPCQGNYCIYCYVTSPEYLAMGNDLASTNSEPPKTHTKSAKVNSKELGANNNE